MISMLFTAILFVSFNGYAQRNSKQSKIQVALIIDTSNSMDGLIDQAKTQLWSVVNELATARYKGKMPTLEIALYEYGNDGLPAEEGYLRQVSGLTTDLDKISEDLFALRTNGGSEFCGYVIDKATINLQWSKSDKDLKMIFIAGNEEFTQGTMLYTTACKNAITKGIVINTIFCGEQNQGINMKWKDAADISDGKYLTINQNQVVEHIASPFDDEIIKLNSKLNSTYIAFGSSGKNKKARQEAQDSNAAGVNTVSAVTRAVSKSTGVYKNAEWDLVDAMDEEETVIESIKDDELPEEMKGMSDGEKKKFIEEKQKEREEIQKEIQVLNQKRKVYVAEKRREKALKSTLGEVMIEAVREQAGKKKYTFKK